MRSKPVAFLLVGLFLVLMASPGKSEPQSHEVYLHPQNIKLLSLYDKEPTTTTSTSTTTTSTTVPPTTTTIATTTTVPKSNATSVHASTASNVWDRLAQCESGGNWSINTGNGFYGGLQFDRSTWLNNGGGQYASYAHQATREQQIAIAEVVRAARGFYPWPACSRKLGLI